MGLPLSSTVLGGVLQAGWLIMGLESYDSRSIAGDLTSLLSIW